MSWLKRQYLLGDGFLNFFGSCLGCFGIRGNLSGNALASGLDLLAQLVVSSARSRSGGSSALGEACGLLLSRLDGVLSRRGEASTEILCFTSNGIGLLGNQRTCLAAPVTKLEILPMFAS